MKIRRQRPTPVLNRMIRIHLKLKSEIRIRNAENCWIRNIDITTDHNNLKRRQRELTRECRPLRGPDQDLKD